MVERVKNVTNVVKSRLHEKKKVYVLSVKTLSDLFNPSCDFEEFESELLSWDYSRIENQLSKPIFSLDYKKLDFLYKLVQINEMKMPSWLSSYFT